MPWVEFTADYDERIANRQMRHHRAGSKALLREAVAADVEAQKKGKRTERERDAESTKSDE